MLEITYQFTLSDTVQLVTVRLSNVKLARSLDTSAPWDISVYISWGEEVAFDRPLSGMDPLHAIELATQFAAQYIQGRAEDAGGRLEPEIHRAPQVR